MVTLHVLSPQNEVGVCNALVTDLRRAWPELAADANDRIDLLVGIRTPTEVDLLIAIDFEEPRPLPPPLDKHAPPTRPISSGLIAIEIKQLDPGCFERIGDQLFAVYRGAREPRSVSDQARDGACGIKAFAAKSGYPNLYIHALAWLTNVDAAQLDGVDPLIVGRGDWRGLFAAACTQHASVTRQDEVTRAGARVVRDRLLLRRALTPLDRNKAERIARTTLVRDLVTDLATLAGTATIRLTGHGGSGKTTALVLLATRLATQHNARVFILTFHHALCGDIRHVLEGMPEAQGLIGDRIHVETATSFLLGLVEAAGGTVPHKDDATIDYDRVEATYREVADATGPSGEAVIAEDPLRFDWDHVFIDEAQDWSDAERDLLISVYGPRRLVLADGLVQLMRRQTSCDWLRGVPKAERVVRALGDSLRMQCNVALFANAFAGAAGFANWSVDPHADLSGGIVLILEGELNDAPALVRAIQAVAATGNANPVDNLICVPHSEIVSEEGGGRHARLAAELRAAGEIVWDASDPLTRTTAPDGTDAWRIVQYDSCRGLEGWATLLVALDDLYANKIKHPNAAATAPGIDPELVARRWLLIPLTRAVHLLVVHVRDPQSPVALMLREAAAAMPRGVVERCPASDGAAFLAALAGKH